MKLIRYGVTLKRISAEDLELVRFWRNSQKIRDNMIYREYITPEMQKKWFDSINNYNNFFYIIQVNNDSIGLIDNKNTDWTMGTTESGLFLYDEKYYNTYIPIAASFILIEVGFYILNGKDARIKVLRTNKKAINYNTRLGFVPINIEDADNQFIEFILTKENLQKKTLKLRNALKSIHSSLDPYLYLYLTPEDYKSGLAYDIENVWKNVKDIYKVKKYSSEDDVILCFNI
jgi:UDP-4-amino-4,6-dideoxy-N-acetyl-beta-L-altrosamine N-acetyltransferase